MANNFKLEQITEMEHTSSTFQMEALSTKGQMLPANFAPKDYHVIIGMLC